MNFNTHKEFMEYALEDDLVIDVSSCIPDGGNENEDFSYVFDDGTPVKECGDLGYKENKNKERLMRESLLQVKRRRMLQFESEVLPFCNEEIPQTFFASQKTDDSIDMAISEMSQWVSTFTDPESASASCSEVLDLSSEEWVAECFNDQEMHLNVETGNNTPETPDGQVTTAGTELDNNLLPKAKEVLDQPLCTRQNVVFKGRKSYMRDPSKLPSSVAYPFDFIKPCGIHGDVTLKDINRKIRTPKQKSKPRDEDQSIPYPKSALTGKPVVNKTKICTEGGTGSITIMRTKG